MLRLACRNASSSSVGHSLSTSAALMTASGAGAGSSPFPSVSLPAQPPCNICSSIKSLQAAQEDYWCDPANLSLSPLVSPWRNQTAMSSSCSATPQCWRNFFMCWAAPACCSYARQGNWPTLPATARILSRIHRMKRCWLVFPYRKHGAVLPCPSVSALSALRRI